MAKYKACCDSVCMLYNCEVRDNGGCYCACRCVDHMNALKSIIEDQGVTKYGSVYLPPDIFKKYLDEMTDEEKSLRNEEKKWAIEEIERLRSVFNEKWNGDSVDENP